MKIVAIVAAIVVVIVGVAVAAVLLNKKQKKAQRAAQRQSAPAPSKQEPIIAETEQPTAPIEEPQKEEIKEVDEIKESNDVDNATEESDEGDNENKVLDDVEDEAEISDDGENETDGENEEFAELKVVVKDGETRYIVIKYSKSFQAKLIQSSDETKMYYSQLKNCLLSYGLKSRMSWKWESFRHGRKTLVKMKLRGKTLSLALALNPDDYVDTKYLVESIADIACYADTPCRYRIKNDRRLKYARELIDKLMSDNLLSASPFAEEVDYAVDFPYETTEALIERKLIKVLTDEEAHSGDTFRPSDVRKSVHAQEVDSILKDEVASVLIEDLGGGSDKTKTAIINIDTLSQYFSDGETVTLDEIKKRLTGYNKSTYIKVLARGTLDKKLTVEADDFSLQAVKMIVLVGGRAVRR